VRLLRSKLSSGNGNLSSSSTDPRDPKVNPRTFGRIQSPRAPYYELHDTIGQTTNVVIQGGPKEDVDPESQDIIRTLDVYQKHESKHQQQ
jgi:hypothetical protein